MSEALYTLEKVSEITSFSKSYLYSLIQKEKFPKPKKYGRTSRWFRSDVDAWLKNQKTLN